MRMVVLDLDRQRFQQMGRRMQLRIISRKLREPLEAIHPVATVHVG
jgi:hypothetical protein